MSRSNVVQRLIRVMEAHAPLTLADVSWDNVGLLVDGSISLADHVEKQSILLTIDLSERVVEEAYRLKCECIVAYHPCLFSAVKRLHPSSPLMKAMLQCISSGISVYSPHTALDACSNGINDWLMQCFQPFTFISPIVPTKGIENVHPLTGMGRIAELTESRSLQQSIDLVKQHLKLSHVRVALPASMTLNSPIKTIAVCAGSGSSLFRQLTRPIDLFITGEMGHHDVLRAVRGDDKAGPCAVILCEHTNTERGYLSSVLQPLLLKELPDLNIHVSEHDQDPLTVV